MITIEDYDFPIEAAVKIIKGKKPCVLTELQKNISMAITGKEPSEEEDMFDLNEIKEIADHLMLFYNSNVRCEEDKCSSN